VTPERLDRVDRFVARHGAKTVVLGRFIGLVRALAPFVAGASGLGYRRFLTASLIGTAAWAAAFVTLGYAFSRSFSDINDALSTGRTGLSALLAAVLAVSALRRRGQARRLEARRASDGSG
jgi:membrane-associated protein